MTTTLVELQQAVFILLLVVAVLILYSVRTTCGVCVCLCAVVIHEQHVCDTCTMQSIGAFMSPACCTAEVVVPSQHSTNANIFVCGCGGILARSLMALLWGFLVSAVCPVRYVWVLVTSKIEEVKAFPNPRPSCQTHATYIQQYIFLRVRNIYEYY